MSVCERVSPSVKWMHWCVLRGSVRIRQENALHDGVRSDALFFPLAPHCISAHCHPFLEPAGCGLSGSGGLCWEQKPCGEGEGDILALGRPHVSLLVLMLVPIFTLMEKRVGEPVSRRQEALGRDGQAGPLLIPAAALHLSRCSRWTDRQLSLPGGAVF